MYRYQFFVCSYLGDLPDQQPAVSRSNLGSLADQLLVGREYLVYFESGQVGRPNIKGWWEKCINALSLSNVT